MCNPAAVAVAVTIISGAYSVHQTRQTAAYEQEVAEENAKADKIRGEYAKQAGNVEEERARARVRQVMGRQRAAFAANNVEVSGSALEILGDTAGQGYADAAIIRSNAVREAWGFNVGEVNQKNRGRAARFNGKSQATGTILTTGAQVAGMWGGAGFGGGGGGSISLGGGVSGGVGGGG